MNNKVTLPPISDIIAGKENQNLGHVAPHPHVTAFPNNGYPVVPYYSFSYMNAAAAAAKSGLPPLYSGASSPSYMYGPNYGGYGGYSGYSEPVAYPGALPMLTTAPPMNSARMLVGAVARKPTMQTPRSPPMGSPVLGLASPVATKSGLLQPRSRTRNNLPKETTYILLKWLNDHLNHPYPNSFEKTQLMMTTGLNQQQLSNWFINARRRKIKTLRQRQRLASS